MSTTTDLNPLALEIVNTSTTTDTYNQIILETGSAHQAYIRGVRSAAAFGADIAFLRRSGASTIAESMRINSSGALLIGATSVYSGGEKLLVVNNAGDWASIFRATTATAGNAYGILVDYSSSPNGVSNWFYRGTVTGGTVLRFEARSNGGIANFSANNVNLSDERTKKDIVNAGNYLDKICAIPVRTFLYKDQTDTQLNLGVIAQEVEAVAPELVDVSGFGETPEDGVPLKAIYQTDLQYALMKCIQEQQAMIDELKAKVAALEAA
jgi:hypothetical protein